MQARVQRLQAAFDNIARTRMAGMPVMHPALAVEALGFGLAPDEPGSDAPATGAHAALGVLLTPWFMNLVWLPLPPARAVPLAQGATRLRHIGGERFEFIGAHEDEAGDYEMCSLFSPMFAFVDQAAARATGLAVLAALRTAAAPTAAPQAAPVDPHEAPPPRRSFLFGRSAAGAPR